MEGRHEGRNLEMSKKKASPRVPDPSEVEHIRREVELPEILDKVEYVYSNHVRLSASKWDIRFAFGDIGPTGEVRPLSGVVLPHLVAKALLKALQRMVESTEKRMGGIHDPDESEIDIT